MTEILCRRRRCTGEAGYSLVESMAALALLMVVLVPTVAMLGEVAFRPGLQERTVALMEAWREMEAALDENLLIGESERLVGRLVIRRLVEEKDEGLQVVEVRVFRAGLETPFVTLKTANIK